MELEIDVDRNRCIGSGQCVHWAPGVFTQDDDAISVVIDPRGEVEDKIVRAVTSCPVQAISLKVGGVTVPAERIANWHAQMVPDHPLVETLGCLSDEHEQLRQLLRSVRDSADTDGRQRLLELLRDHYQHEEQQAYPAICDLVGDRLADVFDHDHASLGEILEETSGTGAIGEAGIDKLAQRLNDHIRLEEAVLFPAAVKALAATVSARVASRR